MSETPLRLLRTPLLIFNAKRDTRLTCQRLYGYKLVVGFTLESRRYYNSVVGEGRVEFLRKWLFATFLSEN